MLTITRFALLSLLLLSFIGCNENNKGDDDKADNPTPLSGNVDTTPNDFSFASLLGAELNKVVISDVALIEGINAEANVTISNGEYGAMMISGV